MTYKVNGLVVFEAIAGMYQGVSRSDPWPVVDGAYWSRTLPPETRAEYERVIAESAGYWYPPTSSSLERARTLATYATEHGVQVDILALWSGYLHDVLGRPDIDLDHAEWLGFDVVAVGEWSLLSAAALRQALSAEGIRVNDHGLLERGEEAARVERIYRHLASRGLVEEIASSPALGVEPVPLYRIMTLRGRTGADAMLDADGNSVQG